MRLLKTEMQRALRRRAVRVLIAIAMVGCVFAGVLAYIGSAGKTTAELRFDDEGHPAIMTDWWIADANEGFLVVAMFFLFLGGFFGGATVAGGEWRAGTMSTVLTWEPRRLRLHSARTAGGAILAFVISFALQVVFLTSFLPAVFVNGSTEGVDGPFWVGLVIVMLRSSALTAAAAVVAIALATLGRNTAFAVITMFAWLIVVEGLIRGVKPSLSRWLWAENLGTVMTWEQLDATDFARGPVVAATTLLLYCAVIVGLAATSFQRRDIAAAT